jgi:hypothetical protein
VEARKRPSILRILNADFFAGISLAMPVFLWMGYILLAIFEKLAWLWWVCLISIPVGIALSAYRCWTIIHIFTHGEEVDAALTRVVFRGERGSIEMDYTYQGEEYQSSSAIMKTSESENLQAGQTVRLVFDPKRPKKAFVVDLFIR